MNSYNKIYSLLVESDQSGYQSEVKGLIAAIKKAKGTPKADSLRTQLDQRMKKHYGGMGRREFAEFGSSLLSTNTKGKKNKGK